MTADPFKLYIIAGEASGDLLGSHIMESLSSAVPYINFFGIGGDSMQAQGLNSLFPMNELSVMGLMEILPHIPRLFRRLNDVAAHIRAVSPHGIITLDAPSFTRRVAKKVKSLDIPLIHVTAPTVWAWRPGRAKKMAQLYDHLFCLFPFEPPYFEREGLKTTFMGHPLTTLLKPYVKPYNPQGPLCLLPGSREREISTMLPIFCRLLRQHPHLCHQGVVLPTLPHLVHKILPHVRDLPIELICDPTKRYPTMAQSRLALAASGTVSLELGLLGIPMIIGYGAHPLTAFLLRLLVKTPYVSLVNILLNQAIVPELLQEACTPEDFYKVITQEASLQKQRDFFPHLWEKVTPFEGLTPQEYVSRYLLTLAPSSPENLKESVK
jgi:lipid-A-disaccharide synthase